jgi:hypothetical protein
MVTCAPAAADTGDRLVIEGNGGTVKVNPLLAAWCALLLAEAFDIAAPCLA